MKRLIIVALWCALFIAACAPPAAPGAVQQPAGPRTKAKDGETLTLYHFGDVTGPYAAITTPLADAFTDAVAWVNKNGGIRGAQIKIEWSDTGGKVENAVSVYNRFREKKPTLIYMYGSPESEALKERISEDKIPVLTAGVSGKGLYPPGYSFGEVPIYSDQFGLFVDWLAANWDKVKPAKGQNLDKPVISIITWDSAYGKGAFTDESKAYAEKKGVKIVSQELFPLTGVTDVTTQILNAKKAGANVIYTNTLAQGPTLIAKDLKSLGVRDEFLIGANNWAMDTTFLALAKENTEGWYGLMANLWYDAESNAGVKLVTQSLADNKRPASHKGVGYLLTFALVDAGKQIIEKTIDRVGFDALTGEEVYKTITTMGELKALDGVLVLGFDKDSRSGRKARIVQIKSGNFVQVQDWTAAPNLAPGAK